MRSGQVVFDRATFHGGTCLRIIHRLDRFSEDLDFSLLEPDPAFDFQPYLNVVVEELGRNGIIVRMNRRPAHGTKPIHSCNIKTNLRALLRLAGFEEDYVRHAIHGEQLSIEIDVDVNPPEVYETELIRCEDALSYTVRADCLLVLFAGKASAVLCRQWKNRIKGRDFYDFRWYVENGIPLDLACMRSRLDKKCANDRHLDRVSLIKMLDERFDGVDWEFAKMDVENFVSDNEPLADWCPGMFKALARRITVINE